MSRIRSIHPGFFTDENVVSVGMEARLCILGLGIEADDKGVFEWKPKRLKMRLFPADAVDMVALLDELVSENLIMRYEIDGKEFGAIRNFRKFQRPKTPNDLHPAPDHIRKYVGLEVIVSEKEPPKLPQFPLLGEMYHQMEDEGEGEGVVDEEANASPSKPLAARKSKEKEIPFERPDWIPETEWASYVAMRVKIRKPMTDHAKWIAIGKLQELASDGHPPGAVLNQSTFNSWQGLFAIKEQNNGQQRKSGNRGGSTRDAAQLALARMGNR